MLPSLTAVGICSWECTVESLICTAKYEYINICYHVYINKIDSIHIFIYLHKCIKCFKECKIWTNACSKCEKNN